MKKFYFLSLIFLSSILVNSNLFGQCTPDPDCVDQQGDGEYCPSELPNAVEDEYYEQTLTIIAPVEQSGFTLHHVDVLDIGNIPPGMSYECQNNQCSFYPATPKCISIFGTPAIGSSGEYNLYLTIEIFIDVVGNPVSMGTFTDSSAVVFIEPQIWGNFLIDGVENPSLLCNNNFTYLVNYSGNATENATYHWDFGDNINVISGEGQGPYEIDYGNSAYIGMDSISLYVEEGIYTSPIHTISYMVDICSGTSTATNNNIAISPNPFDGQIFIQGVQKNGWIRIYDLTAKEVFSSELNAIQNQMNLSDLNPGVYLVSIITDDEILTQKIVKR